MNRRERRRAEAQQRAQDRRLQKDAEEREGKTITTRTWATGAIKVVANDVDCFEWSGTRQEAVALQQAYLDAVNALVPISAHSYAKRAAGYGLRHAESWRCRSAAEKSRQALGTGRHQPKG